VEGREWGEGRSVDGKVKCGGRRSGGEGLSARSVDGREECGPEGGMRGGGGVWGEGLSARSVDRRVVSELEVYYNCVLKIC